MINFPCPYCKSQLTFENALGGSKALCPHCKELILIPKISDEVTGVSVAKSSFSPALQKFVKLRADEIDDDITDNKFLVAKEIKSQHNPAVQKYVNMRADEIDDDITDNKFLVAKEEKKKKLSPTIQKFVREFKKPKPYKKTKE